MLPDDLVPHLAGHRSTVHHTGGLLDDVLADLAPAQRTAVRDALRLMAEQGRRAQARFV